MAYEVGDDIHAVFVEKLIRASRTCVVGVEVCEELLVEIHSDTIGEERVVVGTNREWIRVVHRRCHKFCVAFVDDVKDFITVQSCICFRNMTKLAINRIVLQ